MRCRDIDVQERINFDHGQDRASHQGWSVCVSSYAQDSGEIFRGSTKFLDTFCGTT